jgi:hypothetical protein
MLNLETQAHIRHLFFADHWKQSPAVAAGDVAVMDAAAIQMDSRTCGQYLQNRRDKGYTL